MIQVGDRLVVQSSAFPAYVERIEEEPSTKRTIIYLDWKDFGKSRVYLHDENVTWYKYSNCN